MPSARSTWRSGTSRARRSACRCTNSSAAPDARLLRVLRHWRRQACWHSGATRPSASASGHARRWRPGIARSAWAPATCRLARSSTPAPWSGASSRIAGSCARPSAPTATGASTSTSASTSTMPSRVLQGDGAVRPVLRRGSGARRARADGPAETAPDDRRAADPRRGVGPSLGLQPPRREPRHRLHPRDAAQRGRHHRDDEGGGAVRDARRGDRAALHGPDRHRRARQLPVDRSPVR